MSKARVRDGHGNIRSVEAFGEFSQTIGANVSLFIIVRGPMAFGYFVAHKATGKLMCTVDDSIDSDARTLTSRAIDCLTSLVRRIGVAAVQSIIDNTEKLPAIKFLAGWNMPGCLPDVPFEEFETFEEARTLIVRELDIVLEDLLVGNCTPEADACEHAIEWVRRQSEPFCIGPVNQYYYEVTRAE
jgi:hypothetical protein